MPVPATRGTSSRRRLRRKIKHVIYVIRENRTYDQILGDLPQGNGDPSLTMFAQAITPNRHRLASDFVLLDNFYCLGRGQRRWLAVEHGRRESDFGTKAMPCHYSGRGMEYEYEGFNRNINVALATPPSASSRTRTRPTTRTCCRVRSTSSSRTAPKAPSRAKATSGTRCCATA